MFDMVLEVVIERASVVSTSSVFRKDELLVALRVFQFHQDRWASMGSARRSGI